MKVQIRQVQYVRAEKWPELEETEKKFSAAEARLGFPRNKKRYRSMFGTHDNMSTLIIEFQWDSMSAVETTY